MNGNEDIDRLIAGFVDGTLTDADKEAFERIMQEHPDALQRAADAVRFEVALADAIANDQIELVQERRVVIDRASGLPVRIESINRVSQSTGTKPEPRTQRRRWWNLGMFAAILATGGGVWLATKSQKPSPSPPATADWIALPLKNPGFELPALGATPAEELRDWSDKFTNDKTRLVVDLPTAVHGGKQMARLDHGGHIKQLLSDTRGNALTFEPGLKLRISGWVKPETPIVGKADVLHIALHFVDDQLRQYVATYGILSIDGSGWRRFSLELTVPDQETFEPSYTSGPSASIRGRPVLLSITNISYQTSPKAIFALDDLSMEILPPQAAPNMR